VLIFCLDAEAANDLHDRLSEVLKGDALYTAIANVDDAVSRARAKVARVEGL
jgi:hypothetical protein